IREKLTPAISHFFTAHGNFSTYQHKMRRSLTDICRSCEEEAATVEHIIFRCKAFTDRRTLMADRLEEKGISLRSTLDMFANRDALQILSEFIEDTGYSTAVSPLI